MKPLALLLQRSNYKEQVWREAIAIRDNQQVWREAIAFFTKINEARSHRLAVGNCTLGDTFERSPPHFTHLAHSLLASAANPSSHSKCNRPDASPSTIVTPSGEIVLAVRSYKLTIMAIPAEIIALVERLNQEIDQTDREATEGINLARARLARFPDNEDGF